MSANVDPAEYADLVNWSVLEEILMMDDDNPEFSQNLILTFINQVLDTFQKIDVILRQIMPGDIDYDAYSNSVARTNTIEVPAEFNEVSDPVDSSDGFSKEIEHELELDKEKNLLKLQNPKDIRIQLAAVSEYGHYIKGLALSLGFFTLQKYCERIQNYGNFLNYDSFVLLAENDMFFKRIDDDFDGYMLKLVSKDPVPDELWVFMVKNSLDCAKAEFNKLRDFFRRYFKDDRL